MVGGQCLDLQVVGIAVYASVVPIGNDADVQRAKLDLPANQEQVWVQNTYMIRACEQVLSRTIDPKVGSALDSADSIYRWQKISVWARNYFLT